MISKMKRKIRILYTIECYPPIVSGSGISTKRIATGLAERGYTVAVACPGRGFGLIKNVENNVTIFRLSSIPVLLYREYYFSPFAKRHMDEIFEDFEPDIVHIQDHFFVSTAAYNEAMKRNIPVIGTNHFHPGNLLPHARIKKELIFYKILEKMFWDSFTKVFNELNLVTVPSHSAADIIRNVGVKKPSIYVVSNGINLDLFNNLPIESNIKESIKSKYRIKRQKVVLISVCRLEKEKRVDLLIKALALIKDIADFQFLIVGCGKEKDNLEYLVKSYSISDKVIFTGYITESDLIKLYKISDIFLTASEIELQGISIMEAMASGLPIVASSAMAIPELVLDGVNGYLFEPGNIKNASEKILLLIKNETLRKDLGKNSYTLIQKHDFNKTLDGFEKIYFDVLSSIKRKQLVLSR